MKARWRQLRAFLARYRQPRERLPEARTEVLHPRPVPLPMPDSEYDDRTSLDFWRDAPYIDSGERYRGAHRGGR